MQIAVNVNGTEYSAAIEPRLLLIHFIRDDLGLTGSHWGCDTPVHRLREHRSLGALGRAARGGGRPGRFRRLRRE